ncbi:septal ring lytic transglycosylase RlpA family protein [Aurantiacibacter spongiae]|uniref:Endolytic peptidoglycan transglycosylase RlpA n=2 Tax=Aurantiacibacter spongiae TaxID=2488860 RepID=A0A3N5DTH0_9SPHN|nr:septal ring lytic transglycosylase RlpA family protein [Aurantiacibacter spongiae]
MRLKSQRQILGAGLGFSLALCAILASAVAIDSGPRSDVVPLGRGVASVEDHAVSQFDVPALPERPEVQPAALSPPPPSPRESALGEGHASYYGDELAGNRTASGERFDPESLTAAHRTLPLGSRVRVTNPRNGDSVIVRINDRGPYHGNRVIDLSLAAARAIGLIRAGSGRVSLALLT